MAGMNLKLLKLSDLKLTSTRQKPVYVFIKANDGTTGDSPDAHSTFTNHAIVGFAKTKMYKEPSN